jgi:hypothetical protein
MNQTCDNCGEIIGGQPYKADGDFFCCSGCAAGGPCQCTHNHIPIEDESAQLREAPLREDPAPANPAPATAAGYAVSGPTVAYSTHVASAQPLAWPAPEHVEAVVRQRPHILRVGGLTSQLDLMRLGASLEKQPEVQDLSLVRCDLDDAWFTVTVRDPEILSDVLMRVPGFEVAASPHSAGVDATVSALALEVSAPSTAGEPTLEAQSDARAMPRLWRSDHASACSVTPGNRRRPSSRPRRVHSTRVSGSRMH